MCGGQSLAGGQITGTQSAAKEDTADIMKAVLQILHPYPGAPGGEGIEAVVSRLEAHQHHVKDGNRACDDCGQEKGKADAQKGEKEVLPPLGGAYRQQHRRDNQHQGDGLTVGEDAEEKQGSSQKRQGQQANLPFPIQYHQQTQPDDDIHAVIIGVGVQGGKAAQCPQPVPGTQGFGGDVVRNGEKARCSQCRNGGNYQAEKIAQKNIPAVPLIRNADGILDEQEICGKLQCSLPVQRRGKELTGDSGEEKHRQKHGNHIHLPPDEQGIQNGHQRIQQEYIGQIGLGGSIGAEHGGQGRDQHKEKGNVG